jgi:diacylglycerol kinase (ATP)
MLNYARRFGRSLGFAIEGIGTFFSTQYNAKLHLLATIGTLAAGLWLGLSALEWVLVTLTIGSVWAAEAFNTALEFLTDLASPEIHPLAKKVKDVAAGAVLLTSITAVVVGLLIFGPKIWNLLN